LALSKRKVTDYELSARDRDGGENVVSYNATTFYDRNRRLQRMFAAVRFDRLRDAIDNLDFQLGAELLRQAVLPKNADVPGVKH
jgi:hypothetical protein